jgi:methylated-DNA-[protein]-cysteine S-methyltransferase
VEHLYTHEYASPIGPLYLGVDRTGVAHRVTFHDFRPSLNRNDWSTNKYACGELEYQLEEYFAGSRRHFTVTVAVHGTDFQRAVWGRLQKVAYGHTISYSTLAQKIGRRDAARAVGQAVGANPVVILIPCHRVIRADGSSGDYARGTLPQERGRLIKHHLLSIEDAAQ